MSKLRGQRRTKNDPGEERPNRHDDWNTTGGFGLDPGAKKFLLQRASRTIYEIWIKSVGWKNYSETSFLIWDWKSLQKLHNTPCYWDFGENRCSHTHWWQSDLAKLTKLLRHLLTKKYQFQEFTLNIHFQHSKNTCTEGYSLQHYYNCKIIIIESYLEAQS